MKANIQKHGIDFKDAVYVFAYHDEYDFSHAEQGKFYVPLEETQIPVYLEQFVSSLW